MRLTILGSGTNLHPSRAAAGYLVETDQVMVMDFGPRTLMNLLKSGLDRHRITHVLFSHYHTKAESGRP
jgi:ribonuclease BN (tRNA processing enzyme)